LLQRFSVVPRALAVLAVPRDPFRAPVPLGGEVSDRVEVLPPPVAALAGVLAHVLAVRERHEVGGVVVEGVVVLVVHVPAVGDDLAGMVVPPDVAMQVVAPTAPRCQVVDPMGTLLSIRVAPVGDSPELD